MARTSRTRVKKEADDKVPEVKPVVIQKSEQKPLKRQKPGPKPKPKVATDDCPPKTLSLLPIGKRRKSSNKANTESKVFSQKEKKVFYDCLKENGISCLNDEPLLEQLFPNRSIPEIKAMIDGFTRKAQELNRKPEESQEMDSNGSKQPIEKWFDLIHQMIPNPSKKDDISVILSEVFDDIRNERSSEEVSNILRPDYRAVYDCIAAALNGKYAKPLEPINAFVVVKLIEELKQLIKDDLNSSEFSFLKSGIWWLIPNLTNAQKSYADMFKAIHSQRQQQNENQLTENNAEECLIQSTSGVQSGDNNDGQHSDDESTDVENSFEDLKTYPKLRKIIECLNPLRVPIELMANEYNRW